MVFYLYMGDSCKQSIFDHTMTTIQIIIVSMLQNYNHRYCSHYNIIKFVGFELIHYIINKGVVSSWFLVI